MSDDRYEYSSFARWCWEHRGVSPSENADSLRIEALNALVESVNSGDITSLDGVGSPLSKRIRDRFGIAKFEMNSNWVGSSQDWICPCCLRTKFQISRLGNKGQILAKLVIHHDHMSEAMQAAFHKAFEKYGTHIEQINGLRLVERMGRAFAAYEEVLVCEDCNNADAEAIKYVNSPPYFSFSIGQIKRFISLREHGSHTLVPEYVEQVWSEVSPAYKLRMKIIWAVAKAAATDTHWYEPHQRSAEPIPVLGYSRRAFPPEISRWISVEPLLRALGMNTQVSMPDLSRWRQVVRKPGKVPPPNYVAMVRSEEVRGGIWDALPDDWCCPICARNKHRLVYVGERGKIVFTTRVITGRDAWSSFGRICNHCESTLLSLKREVEQISGTQLRNAYRFVDPADLTKIIVARPHSAHQIRGREAEELINTIVRRLSNVPES